MRSLLVGHLDPSSVELMNEVQDPLRYAFSMDNERTIPATGTGSAAMETASANLVEPGDNRVRLRGRLLQRTDGRDGRPNRR